MQDIQRIESSRIRIICRGQQNYLWRIFKGSESSRIRIRIRIILWGSGGYSKDRDREQQNYLFVGGYSKDRDHQNYF